MKKRFLPVLLGMLVLTTSAQTTTSSTSDKRDAATAKLDRTLRQVQRQHKSYTQSQLSTRSVGSAHENADSLQAAPTINYNGTQQSLLAPLSIIITTQPDASTAVAEMLQQAGQHAQRISSTTVTARISATWIERLSADNRVVRLTSSKRLRPFLQRARESAGVDRVHSGEGLQTPFTGKGVIVGVIDQSFEYKHMGFLDDNGKSRVKAIWDRSRNPDTNKESNSSPFFNIDETTRTHDTYDTGSGHATHVTNIAAGSRHEGNPYYGVAPEADIIMIPSAFDEQEIIEDVAYIKKYAKAAQKPWVVNMSFGGIIGPHDGTTQYDQSVDALARDKGGIVVAATGNEGSDKIHAMATLQPGETRLLFVQHEQGEDATEETGTYVDIWGAEATTSEQFTVTPFLALTRNQSTTEDAVPQIDKRTPTFWKKYLDEGRVESDIDANNGKENHFATIKINQILKDLGKRYDDIVVGFEITALASNTAPTTIHSWIDGTDDYVSFMELQTNSQHKSFTPDNLYIIGEGAASIPSAIAVGSYTTYVPRGQEAYETVGTRSSFSSNGPWLNAQYVKPAVLAPGSHIMSALNQNVTGFERRSASYSNLFRNRTYYYGYMQGTSMATPFVTGTVALWLQANPNLSSEDVMEILRTTSKKTAAMGNQSWTATDGYGMVNAYEGLKMALTMGQTSGLSRVSGSIAPASFNVLPTQWQVLFNNPERKATIEVLSLDGRCVYRQALTTVQQGDEVNIATADFAPGVYVLQVHTSGAKVSQKVVRP